MSRGSKGQKDPGVTEAGVLGSRRWDLGGWDLPPLSCCLSAMCPCPLPLLGRTDPWQSCAQASMQFPEVLVAACCLVTLSCSATCWSGC